MVGKVMAKYKMSNPSPLQIPDSSIEFYISDKA